MVKVKRYQHETNQHLALPGTHEKEHSITFVLLLPQKCKDHKKYEINPYRGAFYKVTSLYSSKCQVMKDKGKQKLFPN